MPLTDTQLINLANEQLCSIKKVIKDDEYLLRELEGTKGGRLAKEVQDLFNKHDLMLETFQKSVKNDEKFKK